LIDLMRDLNQRLGLTFIFSTHDARLLEHTPRIVRLTDGRVVSDAHGAESGGESPASGFPVSALKGDRHAEVFATRV
jgi:energy-coupling factor transporter ATP-binding protein EcfA2